MNYLTIDDIAHELEGTPVFLRVDTNTTLIDGKFEPNERILSAGQTIRRLTDLGTKVIVGTHNGRPGDSDYVSVGPLIDIITNNMVPIKGVGNTFDQDHFNEEAIYAINHIEPGVALLLDNLRFLPGESEKSAPEEYAHSSFVRTLIGECGVRFMVNDGFSVAHRECRSMLGFQEIPNVAGLTMDNELSSLTRVNGFFSQPEGRNVYILGGTKLSDYFPLIETSLEKGTVQKILTGGLLANLALAVRSIDIGEPSMRMLSKGSERSAFLKYGTRLRQLMDAYPDKFMIPVDVLYEAEGGSKAVKVEHIPDELRLKGAILDIGPETIQQYLEVIRRANLVYMKGPVGKFEDDRFSRGSRMVLGGLTDPDVYSVLGGGDTSVMLNRFHTNKRDINYISLAGGALLQALAGKSLPGVVSLERSYELFHKTLRPDKQRTI
ncbi:MAG: phosphoglycerate kinase [Nanoarchaeota archaeon]